MAENGQASFNAIHKVFSGHTKMLPQLEFSPPATNYIGLIEAILKLIHPLYVQSGFRYIALFITHNYLFQNTN